MVQCFAAGCSHRNDRDLCQFFRFPLDLCELNRWKELCNRSNSTPVTANSRLCSCHFEEGRKENGPSIFTTSSPATVQAKSKRLASKKKCYASSRRVQKTGKKCQSRKPLMPDEDNEVMSEIASKLLSSLKSGNSVLGSNVKREVLANDISSSSCSTQCLSLNQRLIATIGEMSQTITKLNDKKAVLQESPSSINELAIAIQRELTTKLFGFCRNQLFCDTLIVVKNSEQEDRSLWAHSAVLAASSNELFMKVTSSFHTTSAKARFVIILPDCDPDAVEVALRFIYTGELVAPEKFYDAEHVAQILTACQALHVPLERFNGVELTIEQDDVSAAENWDIDIQTPEISSPEQHSVDLRSTQFEHSASASEQNVGINPIDDRQHSDFCNDTVSIDVTSSQASSQPPSALITVGTVLEETLRSFESQEERELHRQLVASRQPKVYQCVVCHDVFTTVSKYQHHYKKVHRAAGGTTENVESDSRVQSPKTNMSSVLPVNAEIQSQNSEQQHAHLKAKSLTSSKRQNSDTSCSLPDARQIVVVQYGSQLKKRHHVCEICKEKCRNWSTLMRHKITVHGEQPKTVYSCPVCDKKFAFYDKYYAHKYAHQFRFLCEQCGRRFRDGTQLQCHQRACVPGSAVRAAAARVCELCGLHVANSQALRRHVYRWHTEESVPCTVCGAAYKNRLTMEDHRRQQHPKEPPRHRCDVCQMAFVYPSQMRLHAKRHRLQNLPTGEAVANDISQI